MLCNVCEYEITIADQDVSLRVYVKLGCERLCSKSQKIIYQCYVPIFMVLKTINYFLLASDSVINYLTTRDENFTTNFGCAASLQV